MVNKRELDLHQQELLNVVKATRINLALARAMRAEEIRRRTSMANFEARQLLDRELERIDLETKFNVDDEIEVHASALDEAIIAAYNAEVPIRTIALDGFGNRYDGTVSALVRKLRDDGRLGVRIVNEDGVREGLMAATENVPFPAPIDVNSVLLDRIRINPPTYSNIGPLTLIEPDANGKDGMSVPVSVLVEMDSRDPWFATIATRARPGTAFAKATTCTLFEHPFSKALTVFESDELGDMIWDHPVARWVKEHPEEAKLGYLSAINSIAE